MPLKRYRTTARAKLWQRCCIVVTLLWGAGAPADDTQALIFGVFPYLPTAQLEKLYATVAADLSAATGREVQLRTRPSFDLFREEVLQEHYDLVFIQPFCFVAVAGPHGYESIARPQEPLKAVFVVRADSDIRNFDDLRSTTLSAPPKEAAVSVLAEGTLRQHGLRLGSDIRLIYQNNHAACLSAVLIGKSAACVTAPAPLEVFSARTGVRFRILGYSDAVPGSTYAVHRRLPAHLRAAIAGRILSWKQTATGKALLASLRFSAFVDSNNADYQRVSDILQVMTYPDQFGDDKGHPDARH
jgi:phosphonate transport system substrate-binding protein